MGEFVCIQFDGHLWFSGRSTEMHDNAPALVLNESKAFDVVDNLKVFDTSKIYYVTHTH